jgi:Leucine Rich repeat
MGTCPVCAHQLRVPFLKMPAPPKDGPVAGPPKSRSTRHAPVKGPDEEPPADVVIDKVPDEDLSPDVVIDEDPPPLRSRQRQPVAEYDDDSDDKSRQPEEEEERPRKKKKKKKKKKGSEKRGLSGIHIALIVTSILVVFGTSGLIYYLQRPRAPVDPAEALAELQKEGALFTYDKTPEKALIGVHFTGRESFNYSALSKLTAFPKLERLDLAHTTIGDVHLEWFENCTSLRFLSLAHTHVTGGGMQFLRKMVNLEDLNLSSTLVNDPALEENLKGCTKLKRIALGGTLARGMGLKAVIPGLVVSN